MAMAEHEREALRPRDAADVAAILRTHREPLEPIGTGSKRCIGQPVDAVALDLSALTGLVEYEPAELVLTARAGTPLPLIENELTAHGQRLSFEPPDFGPLLGSSGSQTLGGVLSANLSGSRRVSAGAARDLFLGFEAVTGNGEPFRAGGKVVKNVTGYDLPKLLAGSWGTLAVLTDVTVRVAPAPEAERTLLMSASTAAEAVAIMTNALSSPHDVSAAAFDPQRGCALRVEGFEASVAARVRGVLESLGRPDTESLEGPASRRYWREIAGAQTLAEWPIVWRISVAPSDAPRVLNAIEPERYLLDWAGGLIWAAFAQVDARRVRDALREGHATLWKAPRAVRATTPVFQPLPASIAAVSARIKAALDPEGKLNPGRMSHAN